MNYQQVIQRQQQRLTQLHDHGFLNRGERGLQTVGGVRAVGNAVPTFPAADSVLADAQLIGQLRGGLVGRLNVLADLWSRGCIGVQVNG